MTRMLCFGMLRTREDSSLKKAMRSVSSLTLLGLLQMIVVLGLPLNVPTIILGCIISMLFSDFRAHGPLSLLAPSFAALTEFFDVDAETTVHPLPVSWYFISSL